jgi:hypothetical protein
MLIGMFGKDLLRVLFISMKGELGERGKVSITEDNEKTKEGENPLLNEKVRL